LFKTNNQSHYCVVKDIGELFLDKPDRLVLAFDTLVTEIEKWQPVSYGASVNTIIFTSKKTWLIIRPMKNELDLKFYTDEILDSELIRKVAPQGKKFAHHLRVSHEDELTPIHFDLLRKGFDYSIK
jgi:hypothetical protein